MTKPKTIESPFHRTFRTWAATLCLFSLTLVSCQGWLYNLDPNAGYYLEIEVAGAVIDSTFTNSRSAAVVLSVDDQEPAIVAFACVDEDGTTKAWQLGRDSFEDLGDVLSVLVPVNIDTCGTESVAVVEIWADARAACPTSTEAVVDDARLDELGFSKQQTIAPDQQDCRNSGLAAAYGSFEDEPGNFEAVEVVLTSEDGV